MGSAEWALFTSSWSPSTLRPPQLQKHFKTTGWSDGGTDTGTAEAIVDMEYEKEDLK